MALKLNGIPSKEHAECGRGDLIGSSVKPDRILSVDGPRDHEFEWIKLEITIITLWYDEFAQTLMWMSDFAYQSAKQPEETIEFE